MKRFPSFLFLLISCLSVSAQSNLNNAAHLLERMQKMQQVGIMYGHQDDCFYGLTWEWDANRSETYEAVGDYPGVMGFDLGGIEMDDASNLDSVPFNRIREEAIRQHERGGIITFSWHPRNPLLGTTAWIEQDLRTYHDALPYVERVKACPLTNPKSTVRECLPGGKCNEKFLLWLSRVTLFLQSIKDKDGRPIPFIFRPWHENNGGWFWWGESNCTVEEYRALWNMTQDFISKHLPDNIVWSYSPNLNGNWTLEHFLERYPGNERVDLLGLDAYQWGTESDYRQQLKHDLDFLVPFAQDNHLLFALTECGYKNSPDPTWWSNVLLSELSGYPVCYVLPWRNASYEHFGASKDATTFEDFKMLKTKKKLFFSKDIKKIK